jgi:hypothetical protein
MYAERGKFTEKSEVYNMCSRYVIYKKPAKLQKKYNALTVLLLLRTIHLQ